MTISNYPNGFSNGVTIRGVPIDVPNPGKSFWVNNSTVLAPGGVGGSNGNDGSYLRPFQTLDYAIGKCSANRGDVIYLMPGHSEAIGAAAAVDFDVAGITVIGLGKGSKQSQLRWTAAAGTMHIDEVNITLINLRLTAAAADVTAGINCDKNDFRLIGCRIDEEATDENWVIVCNIADGVDNVEMIECTYHGNDASNDTVLQFAGTHENCVVKDCRFTHSTAQAAAAGFITSATQMINFTLQDNFFHTETAAAASAGVVLANATNTGWAIRNMISTVDTDATAANALACFDTTGLMASGNIFTSGAADTYGVETFLTAENLT
jgi:hypothetical protein